MEKVLVVKNNIIFKDGKWQGLKTDGVEKIYDLILKNSEFINRDEAEVSNKYQQIIPYILFKNKNNFFLYEYLEGAGETRLHRNYILGVAGHINPIDNRKNEDVIEKGIERELEEEIKYQGNILEKKLIGILNDNRREVEKVHLGLIYVYEGNSEEMEIKEKDKMAGEFRNIEEMEPLIGNQENLGWAPLLFPYLKKF